MKANRADRYAVIGNPVAHSKSPAIHAAFAAATGQELEYGRELAPLDGFVATVARLGEAGFRGANVTVPFKEEAARLAAVLSERARAAGAANVLRFDPEGLYADNTDGAGLVADLTRNLGVRLAGQRVLLLGAGGAARGVLQPLLDQAPAELVIANRSVDKAHTLAALGASKGTIVAACGFSALKGERFDLIINATSASLAGELPPLPAGLFAPGAWAYDMMYGDSATPFMKWAGGGGAEYVSDGLGMLVEQAAEAFLVWRGVRPQTAPVLAALRG
jgi:shikimate dehydrogenase